jgi:DNA-binding NtrC family response regulator
MISPTNGGTGAQSSGSNSDTADISKSNRTSLRAMAREAAREVESRIILSALEHHRWNRRRTAEALKISYRSLMYKMKYCKLREGDPPRGSEMK